MMHNCPPPTPLLNRWLLGAAHTNGNYGHILFEQAAPIDDALIDGLRPYFESAHLDAREVFHRAARIDLHPDANGLGGNAQYPNCLPPTAKKGLFGEVIAGLMADLSADTVGASRSSSSAIMRRSKHTFSIWHATPRECAKCPVGMATTLLRSASIRQPAR
jgi:hypothetical protein